LDILHVVPGYVPAYRYGGSVPAVHELCKALVRKEINITVFTTNVNGSEFLDVPINIAVDVEGIKVFYFKLPYPFDYGFSIPLTEAFATKIKEYDIVHIHSVFSYPSVLAGYFSRKNGLPYVITPHATLDPIMIRRKGYLKKRIHMMLFDRINLNKASIIHALSKEEKRWLIELKLKSKVVVIPNGIYPLKYASQLNKSQIFKIFPELKDKIIILFLGRVNFKKGLDILISAYAKVAKEIAESILVIAGPNNEGYSEVVKKQAQECGIQDKVIFTGMITGDDKLSLLENSHIFILPSYSEGISMAMLEAMYCGLPLIITNRVGAFEDVEKHKAGIVIEPDVKQTEEALLKLCVNHIMRKEMGENGRCLVENKFIWDKVAGEMLEMYQGILNCRS
jgi:glycosyltransferase involved in cell wall biosynthesis